MERIRNRSYEWKHRYYIKNREAIIAKVKARIARLKAEDPEGFLMVIREKKRERYRTDDAFRAQEQERSRNYMRQRKHKVKSIKSTSL